MIHGCIYNLLIFPSHSFSGIVQLLGCIYSFGRILGHRKELAMPYVVRDPDGKVSKVSVRPIPGADMLPHDHADVLSFMQQKGVETKLIAEAISELRRTDNEMSRAVEDVITALLKKNLLKLTDLPKAVQDRIAFRVRMRMQIQETYDRASQR